jgi:peptidoglycan/LPS O-acetylase OafA/YrhL
VHFPILIFTRPLWLHLGFAEWNRVWQTSAYVATITAIVGIAAVAFFIIERPARTRFRNQFGQMAPV